ncbi:MAG TPA: DNA primase [Xanthomonadaceae bacterium]|nr:DNA primase [Xanthomonadaceae bacterium]
MARIPDAFIDELLARTDIVDVVGSRVPLKRQGRDLAARCPFHDERSPSFTVSPSKQFYHCFGCGAHGTAISFLMNYERLEFLDAVDELARRAGLEIPKETRTRNENEEFRELYAALDAAAQFFRRQFDASPKAQAYLQQRGIDAQTRARFSIGYAPEGFSSLRDALGTDERRLGLLERAGLFSKSEGGRVFDKFRDRLMFPIADRRGRSIAFGGRVLTADATPKYLNSPETSLFHKGRELYGLWQVRQAQSKLERLIVVEGYMDVVALFQHGITQAVATLGTATTSDHAELLFRSASDVYFCFDGDDAGRRAAWRALESALPRMRDGRQAFFLMLPDGEDPDSLVREEGAAGFDARLAQALPLSQFLFDSLAADVKLDTLDGRARLAERAKPLLAQIPDGAFGDLMQQRLTEITGVGARMSPTPADTAARSARSSGRPKPVPRPTLVRQAIGMLLQQPSLAHEVPIPYTFGGLDLPGVALLTEMLDVIQTRPGITTGLLLEHFAGRDEADALTRLALAQPLAVTAPTPLDARLLDSDEARRPEFLDLIGRLEQQMLQQLIDGLQAKQREGALDEQESQNLRRLLQAQRSAHR